jgi:hypothetical protein
MSRLLASWRSGNDSFRALVRFLNAERNSSFNCFNGSAARCCWIEQCHLAYVMPSGPCGDSPSIYDDTHFAGDNKEQVVIRRPLLNDCPICREVTKFSRIT